MTKFDVQYNELVREVLDNGFDDFNDEVRTKWSQDGAPAHSKFLLSKELDIDVSEVPILSSKHTAVKSPIHEILWFFVLRTSVATYLDEHNVGIWKQWTNKDNNIGKAYGYQAGKKVFTIDGKKVDQIDRLIHQLRNNPSSRRHITMFWNIDDLEEMELPPCWFATQWMVAGGKLYLKTYARSCDLFLGTPFNVYQYYVLLRMVSQVTGIPVGGMKCNMSFPHVYDRHIPLMEEQLKRPHFEAPELIINPDIKELHDFRIEDFELRNYKHGEKIKGDVAV